MILAPPLPPSHPYGPTPPSLHHSLGRSRLSERATAAPPPALRGRGGSARAAMGGKFVFHRGGVATTPELSTGGAEIGRAVTANHGSDGPLYPGLCRGLGLKEQAARREGGESYALRLDMAKAIKLATEMEEERETGKGGPLKWRDAVKGVIAARPGVHGDVVLARKDIATSYHLAVTLDDHSQGVTLVTRGEDLFAATHVHRLLQALLGLYVPDYHHHGLIMGPDGQRLAKRNKAATLRELRKDGVTPVEARKMAGF